MNNKTDSAIETSQTAVQLVLSLIFPDYEIMKMPSLLVLKRQTEKGKQQHIINNDNFEQFKILIKEMFCLSSESSQGYNPANKLAEQIANKLKQRHKKLNQKQGDKPINILSRYISVLALGNHHTIPELMQYTVYQLFDQFKRFERKYSYDTWLQAKLAGAENLHDVENWLSQEEFEPSLAPSSNKIQF